MHRLKTPASCREPNQARICEASGGACTAYVDCEKQGQRA